MKVERLYEIALDLRTDFRTTNILAAMDSLVNALQSQINSPNSNHQEHILNQLDTLTEAAATSRVNTYAPSWINMLEEMGIDEYFGNRLAERITEITKKKKITPTEMHAEINGLKKNLYNISNSISALVESLNYLEFKPDTLAAGGYEISVTIPRTAVQNELGKFGKELGYLERIFGVFSEIVTGSREPSQLRAISSTDPTIFIGSLPAVCAAFVFALERCVAIYNGILDIRIKQQELKKLEMPETIISELSRIIITKMEEGLCAIRQEIKDIHFNKIEEKRHTELSKELHDALKGIMSRLEAGYGFDARGEPVEEVLGTDGQKTIKHDTHYQAVKEARGKIRIFKPQGEPLLGLPRPSNDDAGDS